MNAHSPDAPFEEVTRSAKKLINEGHTLFQKWTCSACGERVTMSTPNLFSKVGKHEGCRIDPEFGTDLVKQGCNYLMIQTNTEKGRKLLAALIEESKEHGS